MMIRNKLLILLFFQVASTVLLCETDIWLSGKNFESPNILPGEVLISVFSETPGNYRIRMAGVETIGGALNRGHTTIPIKMKLSKGVKKLELGIIFIGGLKKVWNLQLIVNGKFYGEEVKSSWGTYYVKMYGAEKMVAVVEKSRLKKFWGKGGENALACNFGKYDSFKGSYTKLNSLSVPVLAIPGMVLKKIAKKKRVKLENGRKIRRKVVKGVFKTGSGKLRRISVLLKIQESP